MSCNLARGRSTGLDWPELPGRWGVKAGLSNWKHWNFVPVECGFGFGHLVVLAPEHFGTLV